MKRIITIISIVSGLTTHCFGQTGSDGAWTKADRESLYEDCLSYISKYKSTSKDQRESIALCYLDGISSKYRKNDFAAKIDIEIKRIREAVITECSKNLGITLSTEVKEEPVVKKEEPKVPEQTNKDICRKENLIGKWRSDANYTLEFQKDGRFVLQYLEPTYGEVTYDRIVNDMKTGDYFVDEKGIVTLVYFWNEEIIKLFKDNKIQKYTKTCSYKVITFSKDYFKFENITNPEPPRQFNRIE